MKKLENAGYRLTPKKCEFFRKEIEWNGHKIDQHGICLLQYKLEAITKIDTPKNEKELNSFLGAMQYLSNYIKNLSANTDKLEKILKKNNEWNWTEEHTNAFNKLNEYITIIPCLAHYNANNEKNTNNGCLYKKIGSNAVAKAEGWKSKGGRIRK